MAVGNSKWPVSSQVVMSFMHFTSAIFLLHCMSSYSTHLTNRNHDILVSIASLACPCFVYNLFYSQNTPWCTLCCIHYIRRRVSHTIPTHYSNSLFQFTIPIHYEEQTFYFCKNARKNFCSLSLLYLRLSTEDWKYDLWGCLVLKSVSECKRKCQNQL